MRSKKNILVFIITMLTGIVMMNACTHKAQEAMPDVHFSTDILPILQTNCAINSGCHIGASNANDHIDFTDSMAYTTIVSKGLLNTANPQASLLYNEVATGTMPQVPYPHLSTAQINLILNWIKEGAKND